MPFKQLNKEQAKDEVKKLVDKYNRILESGSIKRYKEDDTKKDFITPLFKALGWDVENEYNDEEVINEEKVSKGRVDYSFRINGIPKFFLEAKAVQEDLDNIKFVEQAVNYSWHKGCTWAILTNFEDIKIFNAEWKSANPLQAQFGQTLPCQLFLEKFDTLWLLSRESFEKKLLDIEAEKWGKKVKKTPVDKQLLDDLTKFRDLLNKNILKNNASKNLSGDELDEAVQRIIDRLIFIRTLEDKELEAPMLHSVIREDLNKRIYKKLNDIFRNIDDIYNSKLFTPHLCENLEIDDEVLAKIINGLFNTSDSTVYYDFSAIDADVLGNIYEQYLGHILKKTDKRAKLAEGKIHRKEQGIYYTPTYVVDYIVKNTVGELAKDKKFDLKNIEILDPACGSGSFLMKAFDYLVTLDKKKNGDIDQTKLDLTSDSVTYGRKIEILKNNIFGVDLDPKAVEIAQLNLLLKAAEKKHRLPTLQENIKVGNSLIDDFAVAGDKAFKWEEKFKEVIQDGGFDVIIGNPPYAAKLEKEQINYFRNKYPLLSGTVDSYILFILKGLELLKEGGCLCFIVPHFFLTNISSKELREYLLLNFEIVQIVDYTKVKIFKDATKETVIIIIRKPKQKQPNDNNKINIITELLEGKSPNSQPNNTYFIKQKELMNKEANYMININFNAKIQKFIETVSNNSKKLSELVTIIDQGIKTGNDEKYISENKTSELYKLAVNGKHIERYAVKNKKVYVLYDSKQLAEPKNEEWFLIKPKILMQYIRNLSLKWRLIATIDNEGLYSLRNIKTLLPKQSEVDLYFILALLNSKLLNYYYSLFYIDIAIKKNYLEMLPVRDNRKELVKEISVISKQITSVKQKIISDKMTDNLQRLKQEYSELSQKIDVLVYKLYGISQEQIELVEEYFLNDKNE